MHKSKRKWLCVDCYRNTHLEHYYVKNNVWYREAQMSEIGMLCIACLEIRIGRRLVPNDFTNTHINNPQWNAITMRLISRIISD